MVRSTTVVRAGVRTKRNVPAASSRGRPGGHKRGGTAIA